MRKKGKLPMFRHFQDAYHQKTIIKIDIYVHVF